MTGFMSFSSKIFYNIAGRKRVASRFRIADFGLWNEKQKWGLIFIGARGGVPVKVRSG
jgi:hypothetical protein